MTPQELFVAIHEGLPRQAPGDDASTVRALQMLAPLPPHPRVLDLGCGPGAQTLVLARETGGTVLAVDLHEPFLEELRGRAEAAGLQDRIQTLRESMDALRPKSQVYDLVWAEGSAYVLGLPRALRTWRRWLRPGGAMGLTELTWLTVDPPAEARAFWARHYPAMADVEGNLEIMREARFEPVGHFVLPEESWWRDYYAPLEARIDEMREQVRSREDLLAALEEEAAEIALFRRHPGVYGYVFYLLRRP